MSKFDFITGIILYSVGTMTCLILLFLVMYKIVF